MGMQERQVNTNKHDCFSNQKVKENQNDGMLITADMTTNGSGSFIFLLK